MKTLLYIALFIFLYQQAKAQQPDQKITFTVPLKERKITPGELVNIILKIKNNQADTTSTWIRVASNKALQLISKEINPIKLQGNDSLFMPVRLFIPEKTPSGSDYSLTFYLENKTGILHKEACKLILGAEKNVSMSALISSIILTGVADSISIPVKVTNKGNTLQKVNIVSRFPFSSQENGFHNGILLTLHAFADTTIYIRKRVTRDLLQFDAFSINITGIYTNGDLFGQSNIDVQTLKNIRYNTANAATEQYYGNYNNTLTLSTQNFMSDYAAYQLTGGGAIDFPSSRLGYNIDATLFQNMPGKPYLRNTYLSYESHNAGIAAGNITRNFDLNLNGRGAAAFIADTAHKNHYEIGYVDNSSNLIGPGYLIFDSGRSGWAKFEHHNKTFGIKTITIYNKDPHVQVSNALITNELSWSPKKNLRLSATLNGGNTSNYTNPDKQKPGILIGFNLDGKLGKLIFNSSNLMSTSYYPGIRKGTTLFSERLTYTSNKLNLWTGFSYLNNEPKYLSSYISFANKYLTSKAEAGISKTFNRISVSLVPSYQTETGSYSLALNNNIQATLQSMRLSTQINYSTAVQSFYISIEAGTSRNSFNNERRPQLKVNSNYRHGMFNLTASLQYGSFYISEALNNYVLNISKSSSINISPTLQKKILHGKLNAEAGISYNRSSATGNSWLLTGRTEYQLSSKTQFFSSLARSQYSFNQYQYTYNNLQFGITQKIPNARIGTKNNTLKVLLYKDVNQNGQYDNADTAASKQLIYVNSTAFITNENGEITYKNLKEGDYSISSYRSGRWYAPDQRIHLNKKHTLIEIPLSKTGTLKGSISYIFKEFSYEVKRERLGMTIEATDVNGNTTQTKTDDKGQFFFYLPAGKYTVSVNTTDLPDQVECTNNNQTFAVTEDKTENLVFELDVKTRRIETKKFTSPFLAKPNKK